MVGKFVRPGPAFGLGLVILAAAIGCAGSGHHKHRMFPEERSVEELKASIGWIDPEAQSAGQITLKSEELIEFAAWARAARKPAVPVPHRNILVITGGAAYGSYPAGVLVGWTDSGTRPEFDVVTGVSTGALIASLAFIGPSTDCDLRRYYTTLRNDDVYRKRRLLPSILSESLADNAPLERLIHEAITDERIQAAAVEHRKGRRLYVGTSDLDTRRQVVWDLGALAARDGPGDRELIRKILLASAAIPGFFPPVRIPVTVDGVQHVERHIDGVTSSSMLFAPPWVPPEQRANLPAGWLHGSDIYILVAGKMYADPSPVKSRSLAIAGQAVSTILYDQTRSDLHKMFLLSAVTGMNYNVSVIPKDLPAPKSSTEFDTEEMARLFQAGYDWARTDRKWRQTPPGYEPGEGTKYRAGTVLTDTGQRAPICLPPGAGVTIPGVIPDRK
jgi:Patatin-like phospholipase